MEQQTATQHASNNCSRDSETDLISVIVPIYNTERYLDQCLTSIEQQTYRNLEIICLNDGSTDSSLEIIQRHAAQDARIRVVDKENQGYGATCNRGLDEAYGEYLAIVEPDDWIEPRMYEDMIRFAQQFKDGKPIDIVKTPYWRITYPDTPQEKRINCSYRHRIHPNKQPFTLAEAPHLIRHHPSIWSALYRTAFLKENHIRFHEIPGAGWADNPFLADTLFRAQRIVYLDTPFYCYREETPTQEATSIKKNPLLPLDRWNDVQDIVEELEVTDERLIQEVYRRGFTNLGSVIAYVGETSDVLHGARNMFERMDANHVFASDIISPDSKRLFARVMNIPCPPISEQPWKKALVGEFFYTLRNAGLSYTLQKVRGYR